MTKFPQFCDVSSLFWLKTFSCKQAIFDIWSCFVFIYSFIWYSMRLRLVCSLICSLLEIITFWTFQYILVNCNAKFNFKSCKVILCDLNFLFWSKTFRCKPAILLTLRLLLVNIRQEQNYMLITWHKESFRLTLISHNYGINDITQSLTC